MAQGVMVACPRPPETTVLRPPAILDRLLPHPHSSVRRQWPPRTAPAPNAVQPVGDPVSAAWPVSPDPTFFSSSLQPPSLKCCNDRLNPPSTPASPSATAAPRWACGRRWAAVGDAYDNAMAESFFASLECELLDRRSFKSKTEARLAVFTWIEAWYNPRRRHSALEYLSPANYERKHATDTTNPGCPPRRSPPASCGPAAAPWTTLHRRSWRLENQIPTRPRDWVNSSCWAAPADMAHAHRSACLNPSARKNPIEST